MYVWRGIPTAQSFIFEGVSVLGGSAVYVAGTIYSSVGCIGRLQPSSPNMTDNGSYMYVVGGLHSFVTLSPNACLATDTHASALELLNHSGNSP